MFFVVRGSQSQFYLSSLQIALQHVSSWISQGHLCQTPTGFNEQENILFETHDGFQATEWGKCKLHAQDQLI